MWKWGRIGTGVSSGLQNQRARLKPGWVGSIPTRPRHPLVILFHMSQEPLRIIVNPASAGGKGGRVAPALLAALDRADIAYDVVYTQAMGHGTELARQAADEGAERVLAVGGDGTIHEVVNGLLRSEAERTPTLVVLPVGTGNDFYRMVGAGKKVADVVGLLQTGVVSSFDVGQARWDGNDQFFVNLLGVGIDVAVLRKRSAFKRLSGLAQYLASLIAAIAGFKPVPIRVRIGDEVIEGTTTLSSITVGPSAGGGFMLAPGAVPTDGLLDLCHLSGLSFFEIVRYLPMVVKGTHEKLDVVTMRQFSSARLESPTPEPFWFEFDGELVLKPTHAVDIDILPGVLPVLVPEKSL